MMGVSSKACEEGMPLKYKPINLVINFTRASE